MVYDKFYFGNFLPKQNKNLKIINDIRNTKKLLIHCKGCEIFIHLACISNDASFELNNSLSKTINMDSFEPMVKAAKKAKIKRFIYASSSSVYGISQKKKMLQKIIL